MKHLVVRHFLIGGFSFLITYCLVPVIARAAIWFNILDVPDGKIKCHRRPVPYLGGLAVYVGFISVFFSAYSSDAYMYWLLLGVTTLLLTGLIDDLWALLPGQKLIGQLLAVCCFLFCGLYLKKAFFSSYINIIFSVFWMLTIINAFNLVDVMDGLSSLIAIIAGIAFLMIALLGKDFGVSLLLISFLGAICAFFLHNKPPAKIYLGDMGSLFIGGFLSAIPLLLPWSDFMADIRCAPIFILLIPLLEVFFLVVIRTILGIPFYRASPHHFSLYLQRKGWSKRIILLYTGIMALIFATIGILYFINTLSLLVALIFMSVLVAFWCLVVFTQFLNSNTTVDSEPVSQPGDLAH